MLARSWFRGMVFAGACMALPTAQAFDVFQPLPEAPPIPEDNPLTPAKVELGKQLFFDTRLSGDESLSCNSCHNVMASGTVYRPAAAGRNAPTVWNVGFQTVLFWEGRSRNLEEQMVEHVLDPAVMKMPGAAQVAARLAAIPEYRQSFRDAFGHDAEPTLENAAKAVASYERTLLTPGSDFDRYIRGDQAALSEPARHGFSIFIETGCASCHFGVNFAGPAPGPALHMGDGFYELFPNYAGSEYETRYRLAEDLGRYNVTKDPGHKRMWRLPMLRNVALTAPYFHNGSVATLEEAVRVMARVQLNKTLSEQDVRDVVAFLESLTGRFPEQAMPRLPPVPQGAPLAAQSLSPVHKHKVKQ